MATPNSNPSRTPQLSLETLQERHTSLKSTVEHLQTKLSRTRGLVQTLLLGLVVAVLIAFGLAGWLAYRLLVQEQIAQRDLEQAEISAIEAQERLEAIEAQLQTHNRRLEALREDIPTELEALTESVQSNQRQLQLLQDQVQATPAPRARSRSDEAGNDETGNDETGAPASSAR